MSHLARFVRSHALELALIMVAAGLIVFAVIAMQDVLAFTDWPAPEHARPAVTVDLAG